MHHRRTHNMQSRFAAACVLLAMLLPAGAWAAPCSLDLAPGMHRIEVASGGQTRTVPLFVPAAARRGGPLPLVFDLHGSAGNGEIQAAGTGLRSLGELRGFMVANPDGAVTLPAAPDLHYWNIPGAPLINGAAVPEGTADDVQFISDTIDAIARQTCVDLRRIYVTGMSGGARMTSLLACRLSLRIAAVAPVAGLRAGLPGPGPDHGPLPGSCQPQRGVPIVTFHGMDDSVNPFEGAGGAYWGYGVPVALQAWSAFNHCSGTTQRRSITPHVVELRYTGCRHHADIVLYRIEASAAEGGGHVWPGGPWSMAATERPEISASERIWEFFRRHPM